MFPQGVRAVHVGHPFPSLFPGLVAFLGSRRLGRAVEEERSFLSCRLALALDPSIHPSISSQICDPRSTMRCQESPRSAVHWPGRSVWAGAHAYCNASRVTPGPITLSRSLHVAALSDPDGPRGIRPSQTDRQSIAPRSCFAAASQEVSFETEPKQAGKRALHSEGMRAWFRSPQIPQLGLSATVHLLAAAQSICRSPRQVVHDDCTVIGPFLSWRWPPWKLRYLLPAFWHFSAPD
jgi:hypothetical protein